MRVSNKGVTTDFATKATKEKQLMEDSFGCSSETSLLLKKHIKMQPKVKMQRKTKNNIVAPLVFPSCNNKN